MAKKGFKDLSAFMGPKPQKKEEKAEKIEERKKLGEPKEKAVKTVQESAEKKKKESQDTKESPNIIEPVSNESTPLQKVYFPNNPEPIGDIKYKDNYTPKNRESQDSRHIGYLKESNEIIDNMERGVLLKVEYVGGINKAVAFFYDMEDQKIKTWIDTTDHIPYCYHKKSKEELEENLDLISYPGFKSIETVDKFDNLNDKLIKVSKIYAETPSDIGGAKGIKTLLEGAWEANIRYHHNYIYDLSLIPGIFYKIKDGKLSLNKTEGKANTKSDSNKTKMHEIFKNSPQEMQEFASSFESIFLTPIPDYKRIAFDIETEDTETKTVPNPRLAKYRVISIAFVDNFGKKLVYCLDRKEIEQGSYPSDFPKDAEVFFFKKEKELIEETFRLIWEYPIVLTFNGDNFDNLYLYNRARILKIDPLSNPIYTKRGGMAVSTYTFYKQSIHIDLYQIFSNRSLKAYAFGSKYLRNSLEEVGNGMLGKGKFKHPDESIGKLSLAHLIHYNLMDSLLTMELTQFNGNLVIDLLTILMRITKLPIQSVFRYQISMWIRSLMFSEHKRKNYLIPRRSELNLDSSGGHGGMGGAMISGKGFKGAYVITPVPGIHFQTAVLDFSSLYPSIIMTKNLSYETVNCVHEECEDNFLPNTPYTACTKKMGIFAYVVGFIRDVRVKYFKSQINNKTLSDEERARANVMSSALKVFINGSYGVFGSPNFPLYCLPVAESTTAIGRFSIKETIKKSESMDIKVLYGDSDSVFLEKPTSKQVEELVKWSAKYLDLDLELEKTYQFLALSERKKNYIGVYQGGLYVDLKGLMAKKINTPEFIKKKFRDVQEILKDITNMDEFNDKKNRIIKIIKNTVSLIGKPVEKGGYSIDDYAITTAIKQKIEKYTKTMPQHVKALKQLSPQEQKLYDKGSYIQYVKTRSIEKVKPLSHAGLVDIDHIKYKELVKSTFEQLLDALSISWDEIAGIKKLSAFF